MIGWEAFREMTYDQFFSEYAELTMGLKLNLSDSWPVPLQALSPSCRENLRKMGKVLQSGDGAAALETQARRLSLSDGPGDKVGIPEEDETIITVVVRALDSILQKGMQV